MNMPTATMRASLSTARLRKRLLEATRTGAWDAAFQLAREYIRECEGDPFGWIQLAGARYHLDHGNLSEAWKILTTAHLLFPQEPIISATMASLAAIEGNVHLSNQCLQKSLELQNQQLRMAKAPSAFPSFHSDTASEVW